MSHMKHKWRMEYITASSELEDKEFSSNCYAANAVSEDGVDVGQKMPPRLIYNEEKNGLRNIETAKMFRKLLVCLGIYNMNFNSRCLITHNALEITKLHEMSSLMSLLNPETSTLLAKKLKIG